MSDRYLNLVNSPIGSKPSQSRVGLPRPAVLRRYSAGDPLLPGPGRARLDDRTRACAADQARHQGRRGAPSGRPTTSGFGALIVDAREVAAPGDLGRAPRLPRAAAAAPACRRAGCSCSAALRTASTSPPTRPGRRWTGSSARWPRSCSAARPPTSLWVEDEASLESALRFFLSGQVRVRRRAAGPPRRRHRAGAEGLGPAARRQDRARDRCRARHRRGDRRRARPRRRARDRRRPARRRRGAGQGREPDRRDHAASRRRGAPTPRRSCSSTSPRRRRPRHPDPQRRASPATS